MTDNAEAFARRLNGVRDSDPRGGQERFELINVLDAFVRAWQYLAGLLRDPQLRSKQSLTDTLARVISDCENVIFDLNEDLEQAIETHNGARSRSRFALNHRAGHPLRLFFDKVTIPLRREQIKYARTVIDFVAEVALYGPLRPVFILGS